MTTPLIRAANSNPTLAAALATIPGLTEALAAHATATAWTAPTPPPAPRWTAEALAAHARTGADLPDDLLIQMATDTAAHATATDARANITRARAALEEAVRSTVARGARRALTHLDNTLAGIAAAVRDLTDNGLTATTAREAIDTGQVEAFARLGDLTKQYAATRAAQTAMYKATNVGQSKYGETALNRLLPFAVHTRTDLVAHVVDARRANARSVRAAGSPTGDLGRYVDAQEAARTPDWADGSEPETVLLGLCTTPGLEPWVPTKDELLAASDDADALSNPLTRRVSGGYYAQGIDAALAALDNIRTRTETAANRRKAEATKRTPPTKETAA